MVRQSGRNFGKCDQSRRITRGGPARLEILIWRGDQVRGLVNRGRKESKMRVFAAACHSTGGAAVKESCLKHVFEIPSLTEKRTSPFGAGDNALKPCPPLTLAYSAVALLGFGIFF